AGGDPRSGRGRAAGRPGGRGDRDPADDEPDADVRPPLARRRRRGRLPAHRQDVPRGAGARALRAALAVAVAAATLAGSAAGATTGPSFAFGRGGGNIRPQATRIAASGKITVNGKPSGALSRAKLRALLRVATEQRFFALPRQIVCPEMLPDFATLYVTVRSGDRVRTVTQRGS